MCTCLSWDRVNGKGTLAQIMNFSKGHAEMNTWIIGGEVHATLTSDKMIKQTLVQAVM